MQKVSECSRIHAECSRMFQNACRMFQNDQVCMQNAPVCCSMHVECSKNSCRMFQNACRSMSLHAGPWACMQLHKLACSYISLHAVTWGCMQFHELVCSSYLCLSSSQEFRSACSNKQTFLSQILALKNCKRSVMRDALGGLMTGLFPKTLRPTYIP